MHQQLPNLERDVTGHVIPRTPGVLKILANHRFSIDTRDLRFADFTTMDGRYSQVHRQLRGTGYYVVGDHGIPGERGFHESIEAAVTNALHHHYPTPESTDADPREEDRRQ
ncbi:MULTISPECIES: hypothetical protein [unclassified Nocardiopsis]|uniref:hypothetical protein n=1 Tax=unclassified Nocardiopsis TaxID=2649073 RepID=UPI00135BBF99|nr:MULTISPECIES: hypothetical protein [unclassified Nocardiopsis]